MLKGLVHFSLRFRGVVIALACMVIAYGSYVAYHSKYDVFPEFAPPLVVIQTESPGLSPEQTEALVTRPIETALAGMSDLDSLRSQSIQGLSAITAVFRDGTDIYRARQAVAERVSEAASEMPLGAGPPRIAPLTSSTSVFLNVGLTSEAHSPMELRTFADWTLRPRLLSVPGVAKVVIMGGDVRQLQAQVIPDRLVAYGLSLSDVLDAARRATGVRGAGYVENPSQRIVIQTEGQALMASQLGGTVLSRSGGVSVRLKDVARVVEAGAPRIGDAAVMGKPGVILELSSQYDANTLEVTRAVEGALEEMKPLFAREKITLYPSLFRPADFIATALGNIRNSLLLGGILVAAVLFLLLFNVRTAVISLTAIPLSLLMAVILLNHFGISLNTLTLGGLAVAIGEVVDDAIIDVENIHRRLGQQPGELSGRAALRVVLDASIEVRSAVIYATFVVALIFVPVLTMSGVQGRLFRPLGYAYILAILSSLAVAVTVTPALSLVLLPRGKRDGGDAWPARMLKKGYERWLVGAIDRPWPLIAAAAVLMIGALAALPYFGGEFLPGFREGQFILHMSTVPGTSFAESLRLGQEVTRELMKDSRIRSISQRIGRGEEGDDTLGPHDSEFTVVLRPLEGDEGETVQDEIRRKVAQFPGAYFAITPFLTERIEETLSGLTAHVVVKVFGDDLDAVDAKSREVAEVLSGIRGATDVQVESPPGMPQLYVNLRSERMLQFGFSPVDVMEAVRTAYQGAVVGQTYDRDRVFDVSVVLDASDRQDPDQVGRLLLRNPEGRYVALKDLADIGLGMGRYSVSHDGTRRRQAVMCNVRGRDVASFAQEARKRIGETVSFPSGVYAEFAGAGEAQAKARRELLLESLLAGTGIVLLLSMLFGNLRNLLLVLANLPFALVGGVAAIFLTGGWLSVGSLVGFVTLFGITTRNSIMLISHFAHLVEEEGMAWGREAAMRGAGERLLPILMTAAVTALGLLPLAIGSGAPGREIEGPMAMVIVGGLVTSTVLNLLILPALALRFGRFEKRP